MLSFHPIYGRPQSRNLQFMIHLIIKPNFIILANSDDYNIHTLIMFCRFKTSPNFDLKFWFWTKKKA
jgi:hypothetical protein